MMLAAKLVEIHRLSVAKPGDACFSERAVVGTGHESGGAVVEVPTVNPRVERHPVAEQLESNGTCMHYIDRRSMTTPSSSF